MNNPAIDKLREQGSKQLANLKNLRAELEIQVLKRPEFTDTGIEPSEWFMDVLRPIQSCPNCGRSEKDFDFETSFFRHVENCPLSSALLAAYFFGIPIEQSTRGK